MTQPAPVPSRLPQCAQIELLDRPAKTGTAAEFQEGAHVGDFPRSNVADILESRRDILAHALDHVVMLLVGKPVSALNMLDDMVANARRAYQKGDTHAERVRIDVTQAIYNSVIWGWRRSDHIRSL